MPFTFVPLSSQRLESLAQSTPSGTEEVAHFIFPAAQTAIIMSIVEDGLLVWFAEAIWLDQIKEVTAFNTLKCGQWKHWNNKPRIIDPIISGRQNTDAF